MRVRPLTEFCTLNMGQSPDSKTYNDQGNGLPFYQGNADFGEIHPKTRVWCSAPVKIAEAGDILISVRAPIGAMNMAVERCCIGRGLAALTPISEKCGKQFLYYALQSKVESLIAQGTGSTFKAISKKVLEATLIPVYSIHEQEQITATISHVDRAIAARRKQIVLLDQLVKSRFIELFGDGQYPKVALIDLIKEGAGLSYGIVQPGDDGTGDMGVLRPVDMVDGKISTASIKYIDRSIGDGFKKTELTGDELLVTVRGTTGITALTDSRFTGMNVTRGIAVVRYDRNKINPVYLNAYLNTDESQQYIKEHTRGATLQQINLSDLRVQEIIVPPMEQQEQLAAFVEQTDKSKYYSYLCYHSCLLAAQKYRQEWMSCLTLHS